MKRWLVKIEFLDHCHSQVSDKGLSQDVAWGIIIHEDDEVIQICPWASGGDLDNYQSEVFSLVKHPSMKIERIREEDL